MDLATLAHMAEIELTGPDRAMGVRAMMDEVLLGAGFRGYGHYHQEYAKQDGRWRIPRLALTRLHVEPLAKAAG